MVRLESRKVVGSFLQAQVGSPVANFQTNRFAKAGPVYLHLCIRPGKVARGQESFSPRQWLSRGLLAWPGQGTE